MAATTASPGEVRYMTVSAAAEYTSLSEAYIRGALNAGRLAGFKIYGPSHRSGRGHWRTTPDALDAYMADLEAEYERSLRTA